MRSTLPAKRENNVLIAVRGGGHNVGESAVCDAGLVIDCSKMKGIHVDPEARTARMQPGADWGDLDKETQLHGLVTPGGQVSITGVVGLILGGGMGYLRRKWGLSCDNLLSVDIVTADGKVLTASEDKNSGLSGAVGAILGSSLPLNTNWPAYHRSNDAANRLLYRR